MSQEITFILRLLLASVLGAAIGLEREFRAKEAGLRTHFLVTLGAALIMIVSQWGFQGAVNIPGTRHADVARVAAQIVSGIGFLGAGAIIMQNQSVRGLTTAAGLWVAAGIGMAVGGGLYVVAIAGTFFALMGLELFQLLRNVKAKYVNLEFTTQTGSHLVKVTDALNERGYKVVNSVVVTERSAKGDVMHVKLFIKTHPGDDDSQMIALINQFEGVALEKLE